jgi:hypothetical protein
MTWASAFCCSLEIVVAAKQDNASIPIKNNTRDSVILFVLLWMIIIE